MDLCPFKKRERTDKILNEMKCFLDEENEVNSDETPFIMRQLIGYLLYRTEYHEGDKRLAEIGIMLMNNQDITSKKKFEETDALSLMHDMTLSKENTRVLKRYLDKYDLQFPNTTDLLEARKKIKPEIKALNSFTQNPSNLPGVAVDYNELIKMTTASIFDIVNHKTGKFLPSDSKYIMYYKDGADGAGSQTIWKSKSMTGMAQNMYQYSIVPLRLEMCPADGEKQVLWKNPSPNSPLWCRPQELIREKEGNCLHHSIPYTDKCRDILNKEPIVINSWRDEGITYTVQHNIKDTMKDLKFKKEISGLGGADCLLCIYKQKDWLDEEKIINGFAITTTAELTRELYQQLVTPEGEILRKSNDYEQRRGLTKEPITTSDQWSICITHSIINCILWFLKWVARLECEDLQWVEKSNCYGDHIRNATERVSNIIEKELGLRINQVCGSLSKGGGSTDGNTGRRFFSFNALPTILQCVPSKYKDDVHNLHKNLSAALRVISSTSEVNIPLFDNLLKETSLLLSRKYGWVQINYTLHGVLHHSLDLIVLNGGIGLGELSEEALEGNNKYIRRFLELNSRKTSPNDQMTDVIGRLIERSEPYILERKLSYHGKPKSCTTCGSQKHSTKRHDKVNTLNEYDELVNKLLFSSL